MIVLSLVTASCNNDANIDSGEYPDVKVVSVKNFLSGTRSSVLQDEDQMVLQFKDEYAYKRTLCKLESMTDQQRVEYFNSLGFKGAYYLLNKANEELDSIFNIEERNAFEDRLNAFMKKYEGKISFNPDDQYDVTPFMNFTDEETCMVANQDGYVVIGDRLISPKQNTPSFNEGTYILISDATRASAPGPIEPGFKAFKNSSITIANDSKKSTMTIGRIVNGNSFAIEFVTKKKQFLWKKSVSASYSATLEMNSPIFHHINNVTCPKGAKWVILNLPIELVGNNFDAIITNFKSSCGETTGNAELKNIQVI